MATILEAEKIAEKEKRYVALSSVLAAVFITCFKLVIGLLTHSLGILAEAAHSGLDLVAAAVTFLAVRISGRPPDEIHLFGFGKVENLSALFETFLLLVTCTWIIYEAVQRLLFKTVEVEVTIWSFIVMVTSITIDISRSRALMKMAKKHGSQALEADALHFSTDVWSSAVVIAGLVFVFAGEWLKAHTAASPVLIAWLFRADAVAAFGVSIIVIYVSVQLGRRTIEGLLDTAPKGLHQRIIDDVSRIPGILKVRQVRIRPSGPSTFVDMILEIPRTTSFEEAHNISVQAKAHVRQLIERVDVMIHLDPMVVDEKSIVEKVRSVAARQGVSVHSIRAHDIGGNFNLEMHIEVPESLTVEQAHTRISTFEDQLRSETPNVLEINSHIEPLGDKEIWRKGSLEESSRIEEAIQHIMAGTSEISNCHNIQVHREGDLVSVSFHCNVSPGIGISEAHRLTAQFERQLLLEIPELENVIIHIEPQDHQLQELL